MPLSLSAGPADLGALDTPLLVIALPSGGGVDESVSLVDAGLGGAIARGVGRPAFRGGRDETLHIVGGTSGPARVMLLAIGTPSDRVAALRRAGAIAARQAARMGTGSLAMYAGAVTAGEVEALAVGLAAGAWEFTETKSPPPEEERRAPLTSARILAADAAALERGVGSGSAIAEGHALARRLSMMPGTLCTPEYLADTARDIGKRHGLGVTVLGRNEMEKLGMGSLLCVAQGTPQDPKLIVLEYNGGKKGDAPVALVGKGLCFDSGGISIKPAQGMEWMKFDMCGAAGVLRAVQAIARLQIPVNVAGLICATTKMPSSHAAQPGAGGRRLPGKNIR